MNYSAEFLLVGAVAVVGVLHTIVPDHWVPLTLIARQRNWSRRETISAAIKAGTGHVLSTLAIALVVWFAGVAVATHFGHVVDLASSVALIGFGLWIAIAAWLEMRDGGHGHSHSHSHPHSHDYEERQGNSAHDIHGPESHQITTEDGLFELSIYEENMPPHFRLTGIKIDEVQVEVYRESGEKHLFLFKDHGRYLESIEAIPEPHEFKVKVRVGHSDHYHWYEVEFKEHEHVHEGHDHRYKTNPRTALILILGSSPMVEGIPAFFAAGKYGVGLIAIMSVVFGISTIATYVALCTLSTAGLQNFKLGAFEKYGEVFSGAFIALVGLVFWIWPVI
ncbi:MAG TPA: hypothetical protein VK791_02170 [bacterium]|nr:hypothetical protein [bacterium]